MDKTVETNLKRQKPEKHQKRNHVTRTLMITISKIFVSVYLRTQTRTLVYPSWVNTGVCMGVRGNFRVLVKQQTTDAVDGGKVI